MGGPVLLVVKGGPGTLTVVVNRTLLKRERERESVCVCVCVRGMQGEILRNANMCVETLLLTR
jgi:hypothetical protein